MDLLISFDTTGSMYPCLAQVRSRIGELIRTMATEVPNLRVGIIAHGDYIDARKGNYVTKTLPFTSDASKAQDFVAKVGPTNGGDLPECYELVLHLARNMAWSDPDHRVVVLVGDDVPHNVHDSLRQGGTSIDWRVEAQALRDLVGATIFPVQCLARPHRATFYSELGQIGGGQRLVLDQFKDLENLLLSIVYSQTLGGERLQAFADTLQLEGKLTRGLATAIINLGGEAEVTVSDVYTKPRADGLVPVPRSRFQMVRVEDRVSIRDFVDSIGARFQTGRGFYELTKTVLVQEKKEVVLVDKQTGDMFSGAQAREMIGLPFGRRGKVKPHDALRHGAGKFRVFIQSTSYTRVLLPDTWFLYEVEDWGK